MNCECRENLNTIWTIARREFFSYFMSPIAYIYLITFLVISSWIFYRGFFLIGQADMRVFFGMMPWIFLIFVPAVAMGKWADERKQGTLEVLFTLPLRDIDIIIAKFAAGLALIALTLAFTLPIAFTTALLGDMDWGPVIGGYFGLIFMGGAYLAIGLTLSALTENQIIAFILGISVSFLFLIIGTPLIVGGATNWLTQIMQYMGLGSHFESIARGVIDSRDIVYYLSIIGLFIYANLKVLETRARK